MVHILVTGATGMLGTDVVDVLSAHSVSALSRAELDIENADAVLSAVAGHDVVINTAAYTKVDDAESNEDVAFGVNARGAENLAIAAREVGARLIHLSTDYVFNGSATSPYAEATPRDPISAYGRTKAAGEELVLAAHADGTAIVRTAWLYGEHGPNFVDTMLRLSNERETLQVVDDQRGQPTWSRDLANRIADLVNAGVPSGVFHGTNAGETTWFGLARRVFELSGLDPERVQPTDSWSFVRPAPRPQYSVLGHEAWATIGMKPMRSWDDALRERLSQ
ncbi:MAG: dTDP-4-dehydrorhamnose reductase [Actinobacteria bacterium]|nr:dTDP-4-dehydrorhamnose reductase [Actinomycetota bacterium]